MNTELTLYYNPITVNSIKVMLLCNALKIAPEYKKIQLNKGEQRSDSFLQLNPDGKIPVLIDGEYILNESAAILQYLAEKYQSSFWPSEAIYQSKVLKWMFWQCNDWNNTVGVFSHENVVLAHWGIEKNELLSEQFMEHFHRIVTKFNIALKARQYLVGHHYTIADISISSYLMFADEANIPLAQYQNVRSWLEKLKMTFWWKETQLQLSKILTFNMHMHEV